MAPQGNQDLVPGNCKSFCGNGDFADATKLRILQWGYGPGFSEWAPCHTKVLIKAKKKRQSQKAIGQLQQEAGVMPGRGHEPRIAGTL